MKRKTNISVLNNLGMRTTSNMIVGEQSKGYASGDILDANYTKQLIDDNTTSIMETIVGNAPAALDTLEEIADSLLNNTEETVQIVVSTNAENVSVEGLTINVFFNDSTTPSKTATTDSLGMTSIKVPTGYKYKLVFPTIQGYREIAPIVHTASVMQRSVEVNYIEYEESEGENVKVVVNKIQNGQYSAFENIDITLTIDGTTELYTTDAKGEVNFTINYGLTYTVQISTPSGYHIKFGDSGSYTFTAEKSLRIVSYMLVSASDSGIFIVDDIGNEYTSTQWKEALAAQTVSNENAKLIKISTSILQEKGTEFAIDIDMIRERDFAANMQWSPDVSYTFTSIPTNGNSTNADYYYDGYTASTLIKTEADDNSISVPAVSYCLELSRTVGSVTLPGFLGSVGQYSILWSNLAEIDYILQLTRPNSTGNYLLSTLTTNKWTSTQLNANGAYGWTTSAYDSALKSNTGLVVPFFAY